MRLFRPAAIAAAAFVSTVPAFAEHLGEDAAYCRSGKGPAIQVNVQNLKDRTGEIWLELYPANEEDFLRPDMDLVAEGKTFRRTRSRLPAGGSVEICVKVPKAGAYAVLLRHNRVGKDKFSFWSDGAGVPANTALVRSRPTVARSRVVAGNGVTVINVRMQYLKGFGFYPNS